MPTKTSTAIVQSGKMNRRITLQQPVDTPDGQRGVTRTWQTIPGCDRVPASMNYSNVPRKGDETYLAQQVYASAFVIFEIRYRPSININDIDRVVYGDRVFNVRSTGVPEERRTKIQLQCEELQAAGSLH